MRRVRIAEGLGTGSLKRWWFRLKATWFTIRDLEAAYVPPCEHCGGRQCYRWVRKARIYSGRTVSYRVRRFYCWRCDVLAREAPYGWEY